MALSSDDIDKLCDLAKLEIDAGDVPDMCAKLSDIVAMVGELEKADTAAVSPMAHPMDMAQRLRGDCVTETDDHERLQKNAVRVERGLYLVPRVIE